MHHVQIQLNDKTATIAAHRITLYEENRAHEDIYYIQVDNYPVHEVSHATYLEVLHQLHTFNSTCLFNGE